MDMKYQRGELSLFWSAVFIGVTTLAAVAVLLSMRYERNLFGEAWQRIKKGDAARSLQARVPDQMSASGATTIRKCLVGGKVMYSNVECQSADPGSSRVELRDTRGVEPPITPAASAPAEAPAALRDKMVEQAMQR